MDRIAPGTRIQFIVMLKESTCEGYQEILYANIGDCGHIVDEGTDDLYWVKTDDCPKFFVANINDFKVL